MQQVMINSNNPLKIWETLEILVGDERDPGRYRARVEDFMNGGIVITAPEFVEGHTLLRNGCDVLVNITRDDAVYQFSSNIRQSSRPGGSSILTPPKNIRRVQRRLFCRVQTSEKLQYALIEPAMDWDDYDEKLEWQRSSCRDLSGGGMLINLVDKVDSGQLLLLKMDSFVSNDLPGMIVAVCRRVFMQDDRLLAGVEFVSTDRLRKYFSQTQLKRLPTEATKFDNPAQDRLVTFTFNRQIDLRNKGLL